MNLHTSKTAIAAAVVATLTAGGAAAQPAQAAQDDAHALVAAYNASGVELFRQFAAKPGNIVFSPYSIGTAMAMALAGARGENAREMARVLQQSLPRGRIDAANGAVRAKLAAYDRTGATPRCPGDLQLSGDHCEGAPDTRGFCAFPGRRQGDICVVAPIHPPSATLMVANALMLARRADVVADDYVTLLNDKYGAEVFKNAGLAEVNGWVDRKTRGKIDRILDRLDANAAAVILDAVYFKAKWATRFRKEATGGEFFSLSRRHKAKVPTMHLHAHLAVAARPGYRAIRLPYEVDALGMIILVPDEIEGATLLAQRFDAREWTDVAAALRLPENEKLVDLALPRFKASFRADLAASFARQGMARAFDLKRADFSGITGQPPSQVPLAISSIVHRAVIDVMEDGTEAAAATAVVMPAGAAPRQALAFNVDRPFLFALVDDASGATLFAGRVVDPR